MTHEMDRLLADMLRRLDRIERSPGLTNSAVSDDAGIKRIEIGNIGHPKTGVSDFGFTVRNSDGNIVTAVGDEGIIFPAVDYSGVYNIKNSDINVETSGTFVEQFGVRASAFLGTVLFMQFTCQTDSGTTGEIKVIEFVSSAETNTVTLGSGTNTGATCQWDLTDEGIDGSWDGSTITNAVFTIEARRTGGAGDVRIFRPTIVTVGSLSVLTGNPSASALTIS